jgi:hypothetical protein
MLYTSEHSVPILALNVAGLPQEWITWEDAVTYYIKGMVAWTLGDHELKFYGGVNRI